MKWFQLLLGLLFLLFAYFQINDPDPYGWVAIYLATAIICFMGFANKYYLPMIGTTLIAAALWMIGKVSGVLEWIKLGMPSIAEEMSANNEYIESTREFFGLLMMVIVLFWQYRKARKSLT